MNLVATVITLSGLAGMQSLLAQGCCEAGTAMKEGCSMGTSMACQRKESHDANGTSAAAKPAFKAPVQTVFDNYMKVQLALAQDELTGVADAGRSMAKAVQGDPEKSLPSGVAQQSEALTEAKDLAAAREAFKSLSESLIAFTKGQKGAAETYRVAYCPMAKASWLQTGATVLNPYMGKAMMHCGQLKS
jgi:hypothetical protein